MDKMKIIRAIVVPLSVAALYPLVWEVSDYYHVTKPMLVGLLLFFILLFAPIIIPIVYGHKTGDKITSFLSGAVSLPLGLYITYILLDPRYIMDLFLISIPGGIICGLAGYFASKHNPKNLAIASCFGMVWLFIFFLVSTGV